MRLKPIGMNQTLLTIGNYTFLFSYETPVAYVYEPHPDLVFVTKTKYSNTTTRHINKFANGRSKAEITQDELDKFLNNYERK